MKRHFITATTIITALMLTGCGKNVVNTSNEVKITQAKESMKIVKLSEGESKIRTEANKFAWNALGYSIEKDGKKDFMISPLSMVYALGMINNGAGDNTESKISKATGLTGGTDGINKFCHKIMNEFALIDNSTTMNIANAAIINKKLKVKKDFVNTLKDNYDAMAEACDFSKKSTVDKVNSWCAEKTGGMINRMINNINPDDAAIIVNAIYFKGSWKNIFDKKNTKKDKFKTADGSVKDVDMMQKTKIERYTGNETFSAISMLYGNGHYSMQIILPKEGKSIGDAVEVLRNTEWNKFINSMNANKVNVMMPRFDIEYTRDLKPMLTDMGAGDMFNRKKADMSRLCKNKAWISSIMQKTKIEVSEEGTKAAAATGTATIGAFDIEKAKTIKFKADRPFLFVITERNTGMICFIGQYTGN